MKKEYTKHVGKVCKKGNKGITLIALVITIIVLLILVGVTIASITGDNGLLKRAQEAREETEKAQVKELASLTYTEAIMDESVTDDTIMLKVVEKLKKEGYEIEEVTTETSTIVGINLSKETADMETDSNATEINIILDTSSGNNSKKYVKIEEKYYEITIGTNGIKIAENDTDITLDTSTPKENLISTNVDKENIVDISVERILETSYKLKITPKGEGIAKIIITVKGMQISKEITVNVKAPVIKKASEITAEDIGETVTNYKPTEDKETQWRVFFADNEHIYLIASDYIPRDKLPTNNAGHRPEDGSYPRVAFFTAVKEDYKDKWATMIKENKLKDTLITYHKWMSKEENQSKNYDNIKSVAYLLDEAIWTNQYGTKDAEYVIGGPTIEMFCESYKKKHSDKYIEYDINDEYGYKVKWQSDSNYSNSIKGLNTTEFNNLYTINSHTYAWGYWLASPATEVTSVMVNFHDGVLIFAGSNDTNGQGFRPLVCLKSNVKLRKVEDGYKIVE